MAAHASVVIRGGTIVDGTGAPGFVGDIAIDGDTISAIGPPGLKVAGSPREIEAHGKVVTPGWIDIHTHYDGQATWDPLLVPSAQCGVTTCIMGNCGIGFAPCQKELRPFLLELMEAVEDIPGAALIEGIQWEWETFPEYLDALGKREYGCDIAVMIGHGGARTWVMGQRASVSDRPGGPEKDPLTDAEIDAIATVVREAVAAGAVGFSTSRLLLHRDTKGILTPGALAATKELLRVCDAVAEGGGGVFEMSTDFATYDDVPYHLMDAQRKHDFAKSELGWMKQAMRAHDNLRISFGIGYISDVEFFSQYATKAAAFPGQCAVQFQTRPQAFHMSHSSGKNLFAFGSKTYNKVKASCQGDNLQLLAHLREPHTRAAILGEMAEFKPQGKVSHPGWREEFHTNTKGRSMPSYLLLGDLVFPWADTYEPDMSTMLANVATQSGQSAVELCYDLLLDTEGAHAGVLWRPLFGYTGNNDATIRALSLPNILPGFDDAGAHGSILTDATSTTTNISYYARDRKIGNGTLPIERMVKVQTCDAANLFGLNDRGVLAQGKRADINVFDLEELKVRPPHFANDLPTNAGRWLQFAEGYDYILLRGQVTFEGGQHTGALPGRLVRNPLAVGLSAALPSSLGVRASTVESVADDLDLSARAAELSQGGGASAIARVHRHEEQHQQTSKL